MIRTKTEGSFLSRVYMYMAASLLISFASAYGFMHTMLFARLAMASQESGWTIALIGILILVAECYLIHVISREAMTNFSMALIGLFGFSALDGTTLSIILASYQPQLVWEALGISTVLFASLSVTGYFLRNRNMSGVLKQCFGALIAFIIVSFLEIFFHSPLMIIVFSGIGIILFSVMTVADTASIIQLDNQHPGVKGIAVVGAMALYIDFINLFIEILDIFAEITGNNNN